MVGHGGSSAGSYLADPTSPLPSHCASIVATSTVRVKLSAFSSEVTRGSQLPVSSTYGHQKSLVAKWLEQASQEHEMCCHDLEVMSSNPGQVELGVRSTSV